MSAIVAADIDDRYLALIRRFPLVPIRDDEHLTLAIAMIDELIDRDELSDSERDYLYVLSELVERYEDEHVELPHLSGVEMLRFLIEDRGLQQKDLVPVFGTKSITSEVVNGKRKLTIEHIRRLSQFFGMPAGVFIDE